MNSPGDSSIIAKKFVTCFTAIFASLQWSGTKSTVEGELKKWHSLILIAPRRVVAVSHQFGRPSSVGIQIYFMSRCLKWEIGNKSVWKNPKISM